MKIFRKLRQKMLSGGKVGKYLLYAIGEIILVVIGILIAFQIDNNSKQQEIASSEIKILQEISDNLTSDTLDLNFNLRAYESFIPMVKGLTKDLVNREISDTLADKLFVVESYNLNLVLLKSGFINAVNQGLSLTILNDNLRKRISTLYEFDQAYLLELENERIKKQSFETIMNESIIKHLQFKLTEEFIYQIEIKDFNELFNDNELQVKLLDGWNSLHYAKKTYKEYINKANELNADIKEYIKSKE